MTLPGYTAEVTLYRPTQAYGLSVASGGSTERVQPALFPLTVRSSPMFTVSDVLCCEGCWQDGGVCYWNGAGHCLCIWD
jgi:hypothetical protein